MLGFRGLRSTVLFAGLCFALSGPSGAAEGVIELNQASALAAGGFPITIATSGSYVLTSNLDLSGIPNPAGKHAIVVTAPDVTLDLNGFSIVGPDSCDSPSSTISSSGIVSTAAGTSVRDGNILNFGTTGLSLSTSARVAGLRVRCIGGEGIRVGPGSSIDGNLVQLAKVGIEAGAESVLLDNQVDHCVEFGLVLGLDTAMRGNVMVDNTVHGDGWFQYLAPEGFFELGANRCGSNPVCSTGGVCGDGFIGGGETCDDQNLQPGDGCSKFCLVEAGYQCSGIPSVCTPIPVCGNGVVEASEGCDDGNITDGDGCSAVCQVE